MPDPSPEAAVAAVADVLAGKAVDDRSRMIWRATLFGGRFEERLEVIPAAGARPMTTMAQLMAEPGKDERGLAAVDQLAAALAAAVGGRRHAVELTVEAGRVDAVVTTALTQITEDLPPTYQVVVDDREDAEPVGPQGDPARVVELATTYAALYAEVMGEPLALRPPATEDEIADTERALGVTFPPDLRALYRMADGEDGLYGLFGGPIFLPLDLVVARWHSYEPDPSDLVTPEGDPPGVVRTVTWHPRWIPFAEHGDGNVFAVDLAPGPRGTTGQVIEFGGSEDEDMPVPLVAGSVTDLLAELVDMLRAGDVDVEPGERFWMFPSYTQGEFPQPEHVNLKRQSLHDWLAALPDPGQVLELGIHDAGDVDLSPVAALSNLRVLAVAGAIEVTGVHALRSCPLDHLTIDGVYVDMTDVDGHPTLRVLRLSVSQVAGIGAVTRLPALRHLTLDRHEWARLRDDQLPSLATATLTGEISLQAACDWARRLAPATPAPWRHSRARPADG